MKCLTLDPGISRGLLITAGSIPRGINILIYIPVLGIKPVVLANLPKIKETRHLVTCRVYPVVLLPRDILQFWEISRTFENFHSWASASRPMPPTSAFRHHVSQSGTGAFRYRTGFLYPGAVHVLARSYLWWWKGVHPSRLYCSDTAAGGGGERNTPARPN
jgi:hypothetical protein